MTPVCRVNEHVPRFCCPFVSATVTPAVKCFDDVDPLMFVKSVTQKNPPSPVPPKLITALLFAEALQVAPPDDVVPDVSETAHLKPPSEASSTCEDQWLLAEEIELPFRTALGPTVVAGFAPPPHPLAANIVDRAINAANLEYPPPFICFSPCGNRVA
jgi:hypothetical protein